MLVKHRMKSELRRIGGGSQYAARQVYLCEVCDWHFTPGDMKFSGRNDKAHRVLPKGFVV